jgi:hypothetical protein
MAFFLGLSCVFGGFVMILPRLTIRNEPLRKFSEKITPYKMLIGLAILVIGVVTFFVPYHGNGRALIPIFGDLIPSVLAILSGLFISIDFLESLEGLKGKVTDKMKDLLLSYQYPIGYATIFFGALHWFLYKVVLL